MTKEYIRNCTWGVSCDAKWEKLNPTQNINVKFCDSCQREVHRCNDDKEIASNILLNRSVSFSDEAVNTANKVNVTGWGKAPKKQTVYSEPSMDFDDDIPF